LSPAGGRAAAPGFSRPGERGPHRRLQRDPIVIRAVAQARLLGLKILTLDACVVVGEEDSPAPAVPIALPVSSPDVRRQPTRSGLTPPRPGSKPALVHAVQLLEQGIHTLEEVRRPRLERPGRPWLESTAIMLGGEGLAGPTADRAAGPVTLACVG
jgi:hypothetical protein